MSRLLLLTSVLLLLAAAWSCGELHLEGRSDEELVALLSHEQWRTREEARQQIVARGPDRVVGLLLEEWESTGDPLVRDRIAFILHPWGAFAVGDRAVPVLAALVAFNRHLREALPKIRSAPEPDLQKISEGIVRHFGTLMEALRMEIDGELVRYRDNLVSSVIHLRLVLKRGDRARAIGAVAEMSRKIAARVEAHGDLDRDGLPTAWELEHDLDPLLDDSQFDPDGDGRSNLEEYRQNRDPGVSD
ncbi:MAG: hypothetical protein OXH11_08990 [Candidatus Aminicenantes bacterium]|nr:hypothetical protein [Candidatus Aminicenantes bacterium]